MSIKGSLVQESGDTIHQIIEPGDLWLIEEKDEEAYTNRIIGVYLPYEDYGAEVHALDPEDIDLDEFRETGEVPQDLISNETQIGFVFANTSYKLPTALAPQCGRLLLQHILNARYLN